MITADTIAAISSAVGESARMIVRAGGPDVRAIHHQLCDTDEFTGGSARRRRLSFAGLAVPAWVYCFAGPRSVTGEDVIELHIPGNPLLARMLLDELIRLGARQAEPGEFTARAYFNGKIDLAEAEGVAATISAHSERELSAARQLLAGELARRLRPVMDGVAETLGLVEVGIDFSEEDVTFLSPRRITERLDASDEALRSLLHESTRFERLSHEPRIVLVGRPNAGKSTLLNALAGEDRAVVSPRAGTTRDAIWAPLRLRRGVVRVIDVAGLEQSSTADPILRQMQEKALRAVEKADIVVHVREWADQREVMKIPRDVDVRVISKIDQPGWVAGSDDGAIGISAATGANLDQLRERLDGLAFGRDSSAHGLALNARHVRAIGDAREALARARERAGDAAEVLAMELRESLDALGRVLGSVSPDEVLGRIFSTFCIGK